MTLEDVDGGDEEFFDRLAAYDEALATGQTPDPALLLADSTPLSLRLKNARACLRRLEEDRIRALSPPAENLAAPADPPLAAAGESLAFNARGGLTQLGRFQVVRELGRGGCGIVYLAFDPLLRREVALKVPRPEALGTPELRQRFLREAQTAAGLDHPNVVAVHEVGEVGPFCFLVAAYCPGITLTAWLKDQPGPVAPETAATVVVTLAEAVHHVHSRGILHRDLKPSNILVDSGPWTVDGETVPSTVHRPLSTIKITDFGLAKWMEGPGGDTQSGMVLGTPKYMAPEQAAGRIHEIGPATDVYALGVILYEMLTGRTPFSEDPDSHVLKQIMSQEPPSPRRLRPTLPRDLEAVCLKCLEKDSRRRYRSAQDLAEDLRRWLRDERPRAGRLSARVGRVVRRHVLASTVAVLAILAAIVTPVMFYFRDPERQLERIQGQLGRGQAVELIGATGPPSWYRFRLKPANCAVWGDPDKPFTLFSADLFLVELLRDPPVPAYRIRAEIRHINSLVGIEQQDVGIYFLCNGHETNDIQHWFGTLGFNDLVNIGLPEGNPVEFQIFHVLLPPARPPMHWHGYLPKPHVAFFTRSGGTVWRQLAVEVTPTQVVLQWENGPRQAITYPELNKVGDFIRRGQAKSYPAVIPPAFGPRTALGLFVSGGKAAFRNVVVEPLDRE
jgi:serine/threonine-protein kinase